MCERVLINAVQVKQYHSFIRSVPEEEQLNCADMFGTYVFSRP